MSVFSKNNSILFLSGLSLGLILFILIGFSSDKGKTETTEVNEPTGEVDASNEAKNVLIPGDANFANEQVPLQIIDVKEKLDRELIVNTYWHSQTILFHKRAARWFPIIEPILKENGIPEDFKYLAVIESGLDNVVSPSGARGFWQFMEKTGKGYNLEINTHVDERYHVEKSTVAACKYLKEAYDKFGNWTLAAASYNMGKSGLARRLNEQRAASYYDLLLNIETGRYVYRIIAAKYILSNSEQYGFHLEKASLYQPYQTTIIEVDSAINDLVEFSIQQGINYKTLKLLNPWMRKPQLPNPNGKVYNIKIPLNTKELGPVEKPLPGTPEE